MSGPLCTYEQAIQDAAHILAAARAHLATLTPEQAAAEAYSPGGPSIEELAARIRLLRARQTAA